MTTILTFKSLLKRRLRCNKCNKWWWKMEGDRDCNRILTLGTMKVMPILVTIGCDWRGVRNLRAICFKSMRRRANTIWPPNKIESRSSQLPHSIFKASTLSSTLNQPTKRSTTEPPQMLWITHQTIR